MRAPFRRLAALPPRFPARRAAARLALALLGAGIATAPVAGLAQAADPAIAPVRALDDALLAAMKAGKAAGQKGRAALLAPAIDRAFDLPLMTRLAIGPAWTGIAPADQAAVTAAFRRMTIAQYAANFDGYSGQSFAIEPQVQARAGDRLVRTRLIDPGSAPTAIAYRLRGGAGGWRIIDVFYRDAISQLATRRADFARIVQTGGAKALVGHLDALTAKAG